MKYMVSSMSWNVKRTWAPSWWIAESSSLSFVAGKASAFRRTEQQDFFFRASVSAAGALRDVKGSEQSLRKLLEVWWSFETTTSPPQPSILSYQATRRVQIFAYALRVLLSSTTILWQLAILW
jgi:hypothetical protein